MALGRGDTGINVPIYRIIANKGGENMPLISCSHSGIANTGQLLGQYPIRAEGRGHDAVRPFSSLGSQHLWPPECGVGK
jgi:hypothetical protein